MSAHFFLVYLLRYPLQVPACLVDYVVHHAVRLHDYRYSLWGHVYVKFCFIAGSWCVTAAVSRPAGYEKLKCLSAGPACMQGLFFTTGVDALFAVHGC